MENFCFTISGKKRGSCYDSDYNHADEYGNDVRHDDGHVPYVCVFKKQDMICMDAERQ